MTTTSKRLTLSDVVERLTEKGTPNRAVPEVEVTDKHTPQGRGVTDRRVTIPVCEEFPSFWDSLDACIKGMEKLREAFPDETPSLDDQLGASVKALPGRKAPTEPTTIIPPARGGKKS